MLRLDLAGPWKVEVSDHSESLPSLWLSEVPQDSLFRLANSVSLVSTHFLHLLPWSRDYLLPLLQSLNTAEDISL